MRKSLRRRYKKDRTSMKKHLNAIMTNSTAMAIILTYISSRHRAHIQKIWWISRKYPDFDKDYKQNLWGKYLTGYEEFFRTMYFIDRKFYDKYWDKIPSRVAMGDGYGIALKYINSLTTQ